MIKTAIMGYGTVGSGVAEFLEKNRKVIEKKAGVTLDLKYVLDINEFPDSPVADRIIHNFEKIERDGEISIVVETMGGLEPAYEFVKKSLLAGKHVVTSNKALVAAHGTELLKIARGKNVNFFFEASAGGGIPIIRPLTASLVGEDILEISGILNGTTNYILTKMDREGWSFEQALSKAQELGYAERSPEADIEGYDTCRKIAILTALTTGKEVNYEEIPTVGITKITAEDFRYAESLGASIKLLGTSRDVDGTIYAEVGPALIDAENPLYTVNGVYNGIMLVGNMLGVSMFYGSGAGKLPTASAVVGDMITAALNLDKNVPMGWGDKRLEIHPESLLKRRYLARFGGNSEEKSRAVLAAFGPVKTIVLDGLDEFALLTAPMTGEEFDRAAAEVGGLRQRIVAKI